MARCIPPGRLCRGCCHRADPEGPSSTRTGIRGDSRSPSWWGWAAGRALGRAQLLGPGGHPRGKLRQASGDARGSRTVTEHVLPCCHAGLIVTAWGQGKRWRDPVGSVRLSDACRGSFFHPLGLSPSAEWPPRSRSRGPGHGSPCGEEAVGTQVKGEGSKPWLCSRKDTSPLQRDGDGCAGVLSVCPCTSQAQGLTCATALPCATLLARVHSCCWHRSCQHRGSPQPLSPRSPRRLEKELETLENSSSVASTKENLAEAAAPAKEEKAEAVPNAQKVGTAALLGPILPGWGRVCGRRVRGVSASPDLSLLFCRVPWAQSRVGDTRLGRGSCSQGSHW